VAVEIDGRRPMQGIGNSKQVAEREAARAMLAAKGDLT
jgi:dsRNA-specific ribonuclease